MKGGCELTTKFNPSQRFAGLPGAPPGGEDGGVAHSALTLDKEHSKEYKKLRQELKKKT